MVIAFRKISFLLNLIYKQYCIIIHWIILNKKVELPKEIAFLLVYEIVSHGNIKIEMMSSGLVHNTGYSKMAANKLFFCLHVH